MSGILQIVSGSFRGIRAGVNIPERQQRPGKEKSVIMENFRFAVMGAEISRRNSASGPSGGYEVAAAASKSEEKARRWAAANGVKGAYGSYEEMLIKERPDCVYIATTPDSHHALAMLCLEHGNPCAGGKGGVSEQHAGAGGVLALGKGRIFVMEAPLEPVSSRGEEGQEWIGSGYVGKPSFAQIDIGLSRRRTRGTVYRNPKLGVERLLTSPFMPMRSPGSCWGRKTACSVRCLGPTGVDVTDHVRFSIRSCALPDGQL